MLICQFSCSTEALAPSDGDGLLLSRLLMRDYERKSAPVVTQCSYSSDTRELEVGPQPAHAPEKARSYLQVFPYPS